MIISRSTISFSGRGFSDKKPDHTPDHADPGNNARYDNQGQDDLQSQEAKVHPIHNRTFPVIVRTETLQIVPIIHVSLFAVHQLHGNGKKQTKQH